MFGKKKQQDKSRRARQSLPSDRRGAQPVFSYHAQSARSGQEAGRRSTKLLWTNTPPKTSPRPNPKHWPKRAVGLVSAVLIGLLLLGNLFLGRDPEIVSISGSDASRHLLRSQETYAQAARALLADSLANSNKVTVDTTRLAGQLQDKFPELASISVSLPLVGRQPVFYIKPAEPALLLKSTTGDVFVVDATGKAVIQALQVAKLDRLGLVVIEDQSHLPLALGKSALPRDNVAFITEVAGQLKAKKLKIAAMVLPAGTNELDVRLEGTSYVAKFNLRGDARAAVGTFLAAKQHLDREKKTPDSYIDVRVDNRAYYK